MTKPQIVVRESPKGPFVEIDDYEVADLVEDRLTDLDMFYAYRSEVRAGDGRTLYRFQFESDGATIGELQAAIRSIPAEEIDRAWRANNPG